MGKNLYKNWYCILGTIYRNPALLVEYWERLQHNISDVVDVYGSNNIILMGDINEDLLNPNLRHLSNIISMFAMNQLVTEATRITETSQTLLDPFICGNEIEPFVISCNVLPAFCSDHCPIIATIKTKSKFTKVKRDVWVFREANWEQYRIDLERCNLELVFDNNYSVDHVTEFISTSILNCAHNTIPMKKVKLTKNDKAWITPVIKHNMKIRDRLFKNAKRSKKIEDFTSFKQQRNHVVNMIRTAKRNHKQTVVDKINEKNGTDKEWWKLMGSVMSHGHQKSKHIPTLKNVNDELVFDDKEKANVMNIFFASISTVNDVHLNIPDVPILNDDEIIDTFEINEREVLDQIKKLDVRKAYGPDGVSPQFLLQAADILAPIFTKLFRMCLVNGVYPKLWKRANVIPEIIDRSPCYVLEVKFLRK
jgi:L-rhamnose mutarotase